MDIEEIKKLTPLFTIDGGKMGSVLVEPCVRFTFNYVIDDRKAYSNMIINQYALDDPDFPVVEQLQRMLDNDVKKLKANAALGIGGKDATKSINDVRVELGLTAINKEAQNQ